MCDLENELLCALERAQADPRWTQLTGWRNSGLKRWDVKSHTAWKKVTGAGGGDLGTNEEAEGLADF